MTVIRQIKAILFAPLFILGMTNVRGQEQQLKNHFFIEPVFRAGTVLDIYPEVPEHDMAWSAAVNLAWQTAGKQYWNQAMRFPQLGLLIGVTELGNPPVLGQEFSLVPNLAYRFKQFGNFEIMGMAGLGFSWFNKPYNRISNPENIFIGSRITNKTLIAFTLDYQVSKALWLSAGFSYLHYSNGHYQLPNVGINIPSFQAGIKYYPHGSPDHFPGMDTLHSMDKTWRINARIGMGAHEFGDPTKPIGGPKYPVYNGSVYLTKRMGGIINFHSGIHLNYDTGFHDFLDFHDLHSDDRHLRSMTVIGFAGVEFLLGHFSFTTQMGIYFYNPTYKEIQELNDVSESFKNFSKRYLTYKFGGQYYLFQTRYTTRLNPWLGLFIKTNAGQADFAEISVGCAF